ncbi:bifunctional diguanylate cyclase/phosphodiesterase [Salinivibrio kushneri]|uniref:sensor domain-containing protein n=1 Tax=Salinivibrio kushneri TaxID=1908198 RepID=UPI00098913CC|nr:bifunctional diguanylate cyclase/phosphodiesterase [Salinivibrio kushneri]OOE65411.1 c-di-GMP phosphodiesterase [Salinivibrio kushneri]
MPISSLNDWFYCLTDNSPFLFAILDSNDCYLYANQRYSELSGLALPSLKGLSDIDTLGEAFYQSVKPHYDKARRGECAEGEVLLTDNYHSTSFHFSVAPLPNVADESGKPCVIFHAVDTSERQVLASALEEAEEKYHRLSQLIDDGCCVVEDGCILSANPAAAGLLGVGSIDALMGEPLSDYLVSTEKASSTIDSLSRTPLGQGVSVVSAKNSTPLTVSQSPIHLLGKKAHMLRLQPTMTDSSVKRLKPTEKEDASKIGEQQSAYTDALTGLYNRYGFSRELDRLIKAQTPLAMLYLDVDNFKNINDSLGHHVGDRVLQDIAQRLRALLSADTIVGHLGGDEFAVLLPKPATDDAPDQLADKVVGAISQPFELHYFSKYLACSVGMVRYPDDGKDARQLLQNADTAMYEAKEQGRNRVVAYHDSMSKEARMRLWLEIELQKALQNNGLEVWYQPKVSASDYRINGAEALVRWKHPVEGYISPGRFIPVAERCGLIEALGRHVMREVFQNVRRWRQQGMLPGRVAINLSPEQFSSPKLTEHMEKLIKATGAKPEDITFELTESAVMKNDEHALNMLNAIKSLGFALSIDDFGTGYSSLSYLARFPLDELKIDRAFIHDMDALSKQVTLVESIIHLGRAMEMTVVAEGVETRQQASVLTNLHCDTIQGYYFHSPMPKHEFEKLLLKSKPNKQPPQALAPSAQTS